MADNKQEYKEMESEELNDLLLDTQNRLYRLSFNHSIAPLENPTEIRTLRRSIARIKTELKTRQ